MRLLQKAMPRNYLFIIIILVASLIAYFVLMYGVAYLVLMYGINPSSEKALIENQVISPNESVTTLKDLKTGQQAQLIIHYPIFGIPLTASVTDPSGVVVINVNSTSYDRELYAVFEPVLDGKYTLTVTNHGIQDTPIHVIFSNVGNLSTKNPYE